MLSKPLFWTVNEEMIPNLHTRLLRADRPLSTLQALGPAVAPRQRARGLYFGHSEKGVMAVQRQWALPFSVDAEDPQLLAVTGHEGGAGGGVHTQTL